MARGKKGTGKGYVHISGQRGGASKLQNQGRDSVSLEPASSEAAQPSSPLGGESEAPIGAPSTETAQGKGKGKAKAREKSPPLASEDDESDSQAEAKVKPKKKTGPKPKPASEGMKIAATKSASVVFLDPDDEDDALILGDKQRCVSPSTIEASDHLKNWKLWASVKDDLRLKNLVDATKHSMFPARLDSMIQRELKLVKPCTCGLSNRTSLLGMHTLNSSSIA